MRTKGVPISSMLVFMMEHARLCRIFFRVLSGSTSLIVLWYHRILTAHHACRRGNSMVPLVWVAMKYVPSSLCRRSSALSIQPATKVNTLRGPRMRWQSSSSPKPMATASSAAFRSSFAALFSSLSGSRSATSLKTLISRRCSWSRTARLGRG
jgi:hypothetical protein